MKEKILIIEDDRNIARLINHNLAKAGFEVFEAYEGESGLKLVRQLHPHLVILDLMLPQIEGYEVLRILKEDTAVSQIPVIILSAKISPGAIIKGFQMGALDYIPKPFSVGELTTKVSEVLKNLERR
jgi:DNA-binding response OmpR family regulator